MLRKRPENPLLSQLKTHCRRYRRKTYRSC
jgi:hypothetical protein